MLFGSSLIKKVGFGIWNARSINKKYGKKQPRKTQYDIPAKTLQRSYSGIAGFCFPEQRAEPDHTKDLSIGY